MNHQPTTQSTPPLFCLFLCRYMNTPSIVYNPYINASNPIRSSMRSTAVSTTSSLAAVKFNSETCTVSSQPSTPLPLASSVQARRRQITRNTHPKSPQLLNDQYVTTKEEYSWHLPKDMLFCCQSKIMRKNDKRRLSHLTKTPSIIVLWLGSSFYSCPLTNVFYEILDCSAYCRSKI